MHALNTIAVIAVIASVTLLIADLFFRRDSDPFERFARRALGIVCFLYIVFRFVGLSSWGILSRDIMVILIAMAYIFPSALLPFHRAWLEIRGEIEALNLKPEQKYELIGWMHNPFWWLEVPIVVELHARILEAARKELVTLLQRIVEIRE